MQINIPGNRWSQIIIDGAKDMGGFGLANLGDINIGANKIKTTTLSVFEGEADVLYIRNLVNTLYRDLKLSSMSLFGAAAFRTSGLGVSASPGDNEFLPGSAKDNGAGLVEIFRFQGAADPYFQATLPMVLKPSAAPGTPVEGHFYYDSAKRRLCYRDNTSWRTLPDLDNATQPVRALNTEYQNTGLVPILVVVQVQLSNGTNDQVGVDIGAASPPATRLALLDAPAGHVIKPGFSFIVPPQFYYQLTTVVGAPVLLYWTEYD